MRSSPIWIASLLVACGGEAGVDAGTDTPTLDAPSLDAPAPDAADSPSLDAPPVDGGLDAPDAWLALDAPFANACEAARGRCEPVVPGACMDGIVGDARHSCGPGVGVLCCLPRDTPPSCDRVGTAEEGWYGPDGARICLATCAGASATCEAIGTRSEGWYADSTAAGCMTPPVDRLIEWTDCSP